MITLFEGFKDKINNQIELQNKINVYTPGSFIIICTDRWSSFIKKNSSVLFLLQNINVEKIVDYGFRYYANVKIIDYISLDKQDIKIGSDSNIDIQLQNINILFKSNSKIAAINKFEQLKEEYPYKEWIIKNDMEKYNI